VANRLRLTALAALAMLNVFALAAGLAVAGLLPAQLARWRLPRVAAERLTAPGVVLPVPPTSHGLAAALSPLIAQPTLGSHVGVIVTDLATGTVLFARGSTIPATPASSAKLATAVGVLGPSARFTTRVVVGPAPGSIALVGGGDPTLAAGPYPAGQYPQPATLAALASQAAHWLLARGEHTVRLRYDDSLFTGPVTAPGWSASYISTGNVTPITALSVDQGRLTKADQPENRDDPLNYRPRSLTPDAGAAAAFARFLHGQGIRVLPGITAVPAAAGEGRAGVVPTGAVTIASVRSPDVASIAGWMLRESNNVIAEYLARQVALHTGRPASFAGAAAAVIAADARLGVHGGIHLVDGSGLSTLDLITPLALARLVGLAGDGRQAALRAAATGMPVAGFSGTLAPGQSVFGGFGRAALGMVQAKTGNLNTVLSLAGIVSDASGRPLAFAVMADQIPRGELVPAAGVIDRMATTLAGCGCHG